MDRTFCWMLVLVLVSLTTLLTRADQSTAQELVDPATGGELEVNVAATGEQELPAPVQPERGAVPPAGYAQPYLGVTLESRSRNAAVVRSVAAGSPAEQAGLQPGDTIEALNGRRVSSYQNLLDSVAAMQPGEQLDIEVSRRINVRTQAVLDGRPADGRRTVRYTPDLASEAAAINAPLADEPLPVPADYRSPGRQSDPRYRANTTFRRQYSQNQDFRRDDEERDRRPQVRNRGLLNRGDRGRLLLPWRRN
jgi:hypothetical protein